MKKIFFSFLLIYIPQLQAMRYPHLTEDEIAQKIEQHNIQRHAEILKRIEDGNVNDPLKCHNGCFWETDWQDPTPLSWTVRSDKHLALTLALLEKGADPNYAPPTCLYNEKKPLYLAMLHGSYESAKALLAAGANPNTQCHGDFPLHLLYWKNPRSLEERKDMGRYLIRAGADIYLQNQSWKTPILSILEYASEEHKPLACFLLLSDSRYRLCLEIECARRRGKNFNIPKDIIKIIVLYVYPKTQ